MSGDHDSDTVAERCHQCDAALAADQRYCLQCGARKGVLPGVVADRVSALKERGRAGETGSTPVAPAVPAGAEGEAAANDRWSWMPSPQAAAVAVMALLAAGVVIGSVTSPLAQSAPSSAIVLEELGGGEPEVEEEAEAVGGEPSYAPEAAAYAAVPEAPLPASGAPAAAPEAPPPLELPADLEEEELLPEIKHVFLIVLDGHGYEEAFGEKSEAPYLAETLTKEGKLLANYYAVAQGRLANQVALLSGQGPTPQTVEGCPEYKPIEPGTLSVEGQVEGEGCIYPEEAEALPGQLAKAKLSWKAYVEAPGGDEAAAPPAESCFLTPRNPFAYFGGVAESAECAQNDVSLDQLSPDLAKAETTPAFSYILPNICHDGSDKPCAEGQPAGLPPADEFLKTVVPQIVASPAYELEGGLIAITFDQAPQEGEAADLSSCCATPEYPNLPAPAASAEPATPGPVKPGGGGGQVGMLLISPYVVGGTIDESGYYNHFSFLRSVEEVLGLEPLGYAAEPALSGFDSSVYDGSPEESTLAEK
jgi:phosphatidylinositol-3-phosphatase